MKNAFGLPYQLALLATPILASSAIAVLPSQAATLALSDVKASISQFSSTVTDPGALTDTNTDTAAASGTVSATADAEAQFLPDPNTGTAIGENFVTTKVNGEGTDYTGTGSGVAQVIGTFLLTPNAPFSFYFTALINLETAVDSPGTESAQAFGQVLFKLLDSKTGSELDTFGLSGQLGASGSSTPFTSIANPYVALANDTTQWQIEGGRSLASANLSGTYARTFGELTAVTLVEVKLSEAQTTAAVPEPSEVLGTGAAIGLLLGGYWWKTSRRRTRLEHH